ncbi:MAG: sugar kinase [Chloroflexi bacterium]|nr:sugar kinase [Chloroflexota bacterium]
MLLAGTVPLNDLPLIVGQVRAEEEFLIVDGHRIACTQGTGAMVSAALAVTEYLKLDPPQIVVAGDIGQGNGSRAIYEYLIQKMPELSAEVLTLHYCLPDMALMRRLCESVARCTRKPVMIADAASMYVAKAVGLASQFDIFTPDATELAFLADPEATHPAYIARHLFDTDMAQAPKLIASAYEQNGAARLLLVKGAVDYVVRAGDVDMISEPDVPELEAIGGTGDAITGLVSAFAYAGLELHEAAIISARANRMAGKFAQVTPATKIWQIIKKFPDVMKEHLCSWSGVCYTTDIRGGAING